MAGIKIETLKNIEINPLRLSPSLGAAIFFLGIKNAVVLMHGAVGCASFDKVTLTKHYRENIPIVTTALNEYGAILGGTDFLISGIKNVNEKIKPDFIGITSTGLTETNGEDVVAAISEFKNSLQAPFASFVYASTPDFRGGLEDGYREALLALLEDFLGKDKDKGCNDVWRDTANNRNCNKLRVSELNSDTRRRGSVNVFCPSSFTPQDFLELREVFDYFGFKPIMVPDLGMSLDGHLDERGYLQATSGGFDTMNACADLKNSEFNILIGLSLKETEDTVSNLTGLKTYYLPNVCGLKNSDKFFRLLSKLSGKKIPGKYIMHRKQLMDVYLDAHFYFLGKNIALVLSTDIIDSFSTIYTEIGANLEIGITTKFNQDIKRRFLNFFEGDLDLLENYANIDLIVSNSSAKFYAKNLSVPLLKAGIPLIDEIGHSFKSYILYKGAMNLAIESANLLSEE